MFDIISLHYDCFSGGRPKNHPVLEKASEEVRARTILFRNVSFLCIVFFFLAMAIVSDSIICFISL